MKLRKRIAAFGAAMVMAVSMMSIGAGATYYPEADYYDDFEPLIYGSTMPSYLCHTSSDAYVRARTSGSTIYVSATITKTVYVGSPYMLAEASGSSSKPKFYNSGTQPIYFSSTALPEGNFATVNVSLKGYTGNSISANGHASN